MIKTLFFKEWIKIRYICWLPLFVVGVTLCDYYWTLLAVQSMHGSINLWAGLMFKETIYFPNIKWAFIFSGIWLACFQLLPECMGQRLRLFFHLPIHHRKALAVIICTAIIQMLLLFIITGLAFTFVNNQFNFPAELSTPLLLTLIPWALAGLVSWCATAAIIADPSFMRKIMLGLVGIGYINILLAEQGFAGMQEPLYLYVLICLPWAFALESSALRIKEGK